MFDYNRNLLPNQYLAELEDGVTTIEEAKQRSGLTIGYPGWGVIYHILLSHLDRDREEILIETGTNQGCTTIILAQALIDSGCKGKVITVELDEKNADIAEKNFHRAGVSDRIDLRIGNSHDILPGITNEIDSVRFAFLDASHIYSDVLFEFETIYPVLKNDALLIFDNTYEISDPGEDMYVHGALKKIKQKYSVDLINLEKVSWFTPGLAVLQKNSSFDS